MSAVADLKDGVIYAAIDIDAPPEQVWDALTQPEQLSSWWGSADTYRTFNWQLDLRPGGKWSSEHERVDGTQRGTVHGEYLEVDPPRLLVYTWRPSFDAFRETLIRLELSPTASGTHVKIKHSGFIPGSPAALSHTNGWQRLLGQVSDWLMARAALR
jgi:uncharacterized protein YndB with AHSA1/START domain